MSKHKKAGKKVLLCPVCAKGRVLDVADKMGASRIRLLRPENAEQADWFVKCPKCGAQIGGTTI